MKWALWALGALAAAVGVYLVTRRKGSSGGLAGVPMVLSPNRSPRGKSTVKAVVVHYTAGSTAKGAVDWFANTAARASAHFVIGTDGAVTQCVPLDESAWHTGNASIGNGSTIGIELVNVGPVVKGSRGWEWKLGAAGTPQVYRGPEPQRGAIGWPNGHSVAGFWAPYPDVQIAALQKLLADLGRLGYPVNELLGHEDIAQPAGRKTDPGPLFPWSRFPRAAGRKTVAV